MLEVHCALHSLNLLNSSTNPLVITGSEDKCFVARSDAYERSTEGLRFSFVPTTLVVVAFK